MHGFQATTGRRVVLTSAHRSSQKQSRLREDYESGRSKVPANRPGDSAHEYGLALDFDIVGAPYRGNRDLWQRFWAQARGQGFHVIGPRDPYHVEVPNWRAFVARTQGAGRR